MKLYLVNPRGKIGSHSYDFSAPVVMKKYLNPPLGLQTLAALCASEHTVEICDENVEKIDWHHDADVVCLTGMHIQGKRLREIAAAFRRQGKFVVIGGPAATSTPERFRDHADCLVLGEAEYIWPECLEDIACGRTKSLYQATEKVDMKHSPLPRFDLCNHKKYVHMVVQTTRGCPYLCEFCDVITLFGRTPRSKPIENVIRELETISELGAASFFMADDNIIGNPHYAMDLLGEIERLQKRLRRPLTFSCQVTINLARNIPLLRQLQAAGCQNAFIGIETPRRESLAETRKVQNLKSDLVRDIWTIQEHGIFVESGMIVGFDHDDASIFAEQLDFAMASGVAAPMPAKLTALPGTPLYARLEREGRLFADSQMDLNCVDSNIVPLKMTASELDAGHRGLVAALFEPNSYARRVGSELSRIAPASAHTVRRLSRPLLILAMLWVGTLYAIDRERRALFRVYTELLKLFWRMGFPAGEGVLRRMVEFRHKYYFAKLVVEAK